MLAVGVEPNFATSVKRGGKLATVHPYVAFYLHAFLTRALLTVNSSQKIASYKLEPTQLNRMARTKA